MDILQYPFFQNALAGIILIAITASIIGTYIVTRRIVFIAGGITHTTLGGLGLATWLSLPILPTATAFAITGTLTIQLLSAHRHRTDTAIAIVWAIGMALGILFIFLTPGYVPELNTFLFGNVLTLTPADNITFFIFTLLVILLFTTYRQRIIAISFDQDFATTRHLPVNTINTLLNIAMAIAIVLIIRMIGIMLLISMLTIPQAIAETHTHRYTPLIIKSTAISLTASIGGLITAYWLNVPASATIVLLLSAIYLLNLIPIRHRKTI